MPRFPRVGVMTVAYLCLCLGGYVGLVVVFLALQNTPSRQPAATSSQPEGWDLESGKTLTCEDIPYVTNTTLVGAGWTKAVYRGRYEGVWVAVKTVHTAGHDMAGCPGPAAHCYQRCADKMHRENHLLRRLSHPNVVRVVGECWPDEAYDPGPPASGLVFAVTELGRDLDVLAMLQMDFEDRLKLVMDVVSLVQYLAESPMGPLLMKDFRRQQFVFVDNTVKLSDADDLVVGDPGCDQGCTVELEGQRTTQVTCMEGVCRGFNSLSNAVQAGHHFLKLLMPFGAPGVLEAAGRDIVTRTLAGRLSSQHLYREVSHLVANYSSGIYLGNNERNSLKDFEVHPGQTVTEGNFMCRKTASWGCVASVSCAAEGAWLCSLMHQCRAFVLLDQWSWTGRQVAVFKASSEGRGGHHQHTLYVRRGQG